MRTKGGGGKKGGGGCGGAVKVKRDAESSWSDFWYKSPSSTSASPINVTTTTEFSSKTFDKTTEFPIE